jgi:hypothetical protein
MHAFISILATILIHAVLYEIASSSYQIRTIAKIDWTVVGQNYINKGCKYNINGQCTGYCPLTLKRCEEIANFDTKICGCNYCTFNSSTSKCNGQCSNILLDSCVGKVPLPKKDSDCICTSCTSTWVNVNVGDEYYPEYEDVPSCNDSTCGGNSCEPVYVSLSRRQRVNDTLYCNCKNSFY